MAVISYVSVPWQYALTTFATSGTFPATLPTTTEPAASATTGVIDLQSVNGGLVPQWIKLMILGTNADNATAITRIIGWDKYKTTSGTIWLPHSLATFTGTLSSTVKGVDTSVIEDEIFFADTIAITDGSTDYNRFSNAPSNAAAACAFCNIRGFKKIQIQSATGTGASANTLWAPMPTS